MKLKEKLLNIFLNATKDLKTKRQVEWCLHDIYETGFTIFVVLAIVAIATWSGWALFLALTVWLFLIFGWDWFSYKSREILLGYLYPENFEDTQELQEIQLDNLFKQIDNVIKVLNE